jgi:hypothetical protein
MESTITLMAAMSTSPKMIALIARTYHFQSLVTEFRNRE